MMYGREGHAKYGNVGRGLYKIYFFSQKKKHENNKKDKRVNTRMYTETQKSQANKLREIQFTV